MFGEFLWGRSSRAVPSLAAIVVIGLGALSGPADSGETQEDAVASPAPADAKSHIEALVGDWFGVLQDSATPATELFKLLASEPFELEMDGQVIRDRDALLAWASMIRARYSQIEFRIESIKIEPEGPDRYFARFEFDRIALDPDGMRHVARREHTWLVDDGSEAGVFVLAIEERALMFYPGTGPRIVCY